MWENKGIVILYIITSFHREQTRQVILAVIFILPFPSSALMVPVLLRWRMLCRFKCEIHFFPFFSVSVFSHSDCLDHFQTHSAQSRLIKSCLSIAAPGPCGARVRLQSAVAGAARSFEPFKLTTDFNVSFGDYLVFSFRMGACDHMLKCQNMSAQSSRRRDLTSLVAHGLGETGPQR